MQQDGIQSPAGFPNHQNLISGRYRLISPLGKGGFGEVFKAEDIKYKPPRPVAIKLLHQRFLGEPNLLIDIEREASILAKFAHPNILRVLDFEVNSDRPYIVTELAGGGSLAGKLRPNPARPPV